MVLDVEVMPGNKQSYRRFFGDGAKGRAAAFLASVAADFAATSIPFLEP
jgi:hypothetical protein